MELKKLRENIAVMALLLIGCIYMWFWGIAGQVPESKAARGQAFTPRTFPRICIAIIAVCVAAGLVCYIRDYLKEAGKSADTERKENRKTKREVVASLIPYGVFALSVLYYYLYNHGGWVVGTAIVTPLILACLGCRKWKYYLITYGFSALMYCLFVFVLHVRLP